MDQEEQNVRLLTKPQPADIAYAIGLALACLISYWVMTRILNPFVARDDDLLGGMWAAIAAAFVFRDTTNAALSASLGRLIATAVSCLTCLALLVLVRPTALGMALILIVGTLLLIAMNLRDTIITMAITTIVVMVVAILTPEDGRIQPLLRFIDTVVGIAVGVACRWIASLLQARDRALQGSGILR